MQKNSEQTATALLSRKHRSKNKHKERMILFRDISPDFVLLNVIMARNSCLINLEGLRINELAGVVVGGGRCGENNQLFEGKVRLQKQFRMSTRVAENSDR